MNRQSTRCNNRRAMKPISRGMHITSNLNCARNSAEPIWWSEVIPKHNFSRFSMHQGMQNTDHGNHPNIEIVSSDHAWIWPLCTNIRSLSTNIRFRAPLNWETAWNHSIKFISYKFQTSAMDTSINSKTGKSTIHSNIQEMHKITILP
jgi:hypothetical protein